MLFHKIVAYHIFIKQCFHFIITIIIILLAFTTHLRVLASSFLRFRNYTQWHNRVGRTPLDEWSARRRDLYLSNTQHSQQTNIHALGGIRILSPSRRAAADPRLRPHGQWDRQCFPLWHKMFSLILIDVFMLLTLKHDVTVAIIPTDILFRISLWHVPILYILVTENFKNSIVSNKLSFCV
jgi:hypothetical protein